MLFMLHRGDPKVFTSAARPQRHLRGQTGRMTGAQASYHYLTELILGSAAEQQPQVTGSECTRAGVQTQATLPPLEHLI